MKFTRPVAALNLDARGVAILDLELQKAPGDDLLLRNYQIGELFLDRIKKFYYISHTFFE